MVRQATDLPTQYVPAFDGIRAIAIALVLVGHSEMAGTFGLFSGTAGVSLFLVLSGFLITRLLLREELDTGAISIGNFYARRAIRILPAFYLSLGSLILLDRAGLVWRPGIHTYLASALFYRNCFGLGWETAHFWSLALEEQFYLVWPLVFVISRRWRTHITLGTVAGIFLWRIIVVVGQGNTTGFLIRPDLRMDTLLIGCAAALLEKKVRPRPAWVFACLLLSPIWQVASTASLATLSVSTGISAVLASLALLGLVHHQGSILARVLSMRPLRALGRISYSLYLWQQLFLGPTSLAVKSMPLKLLGLAGCVAASYFLVERPLMAWRRRMGASSAASSKDALKDVADVPQLAVERERLGDLVAG